MTQGTIKASDDVRTALRAGEWIWGGIGVGAASLSACFAAYMLAFGPAEISIRNPGEFGLFARMRSNERVAQTNVAPILAGQLRSGGSAGGSDAPATVVASTAVDFSPTGSLDGKADANDVKTSQDLASSLVGSEKLLPSFILRDVFDGKALVETPSALTLVSKGSVIAGAGEVLSIERRGKQWAVVTSGGIIGASR